MRRGAASERPAPIAVAADNSQSNHRIGRPHVRMTRDHPRENPVAPTTKYPPARGGDSGRAPEHALQPERHRRRHESVRIRPPCRLRSNAADDPGVVRDADEHRQNARLTHPTPPVS